MHRTSYAKLIHDLYDYGYITPDDSDISEFEITFSQYLKDERYKKEGINLIESSYSILIPDKYDFETELENGNIFNDDAVLKHSDIIELDEFRTCKHKELHARVVLTQDRYYTRSDPNADYQETERETYGIDWNTATVLCMDCEKEIKPKDIGLENFNEL